MSKEVIEALEAARAHILDAYRIWQADDVSAVPPPLSGAGSVIAKIDAVLSSPIAVEAPEGWQLVPVNMDVGMIGAWYRYKNGWHSHGDEPPRDTSDVGAWAALLAAAPVPPSSPGKDGGQEVEAVNSVVSDFVNGLRRLPKADRGIWWQLSNWRGTKELTVYGDTAALCKWVLDNDAALIAALERPQPASTALVERLDPIGYIGQSSADMLRSGEISGAALSREATKSSTVPVFTDCTKQVEAETWGALCKLTFVVQHNPNCPSPWLVRLAGKGPIDLKPYSDGLGLRKHETGDILGFGKTFTEAALAALSASTSREGER